MTDPIKFTTNANVKAWLGGITITGTDIVIDRLILAATDFIRRYTQRDILSQNYAETLDGNGGQVQNLFNFPVTALSQVIIDAQNIPITTSSVAAGVRFADSRLIANPPYVFCRGNANVVVSYTAGYATVPNDIEQACIEIVGVKYRERERIGELSKSIAGEVISFFAKDCPPTALTTLNNWKRVAPQW